MASANSPIGPLAPLPSFTGSTGNREHEVPDSLWVRDSLGSSVTAPSEKLPSFLPETPTEPNPSEPTAAPEHVWPRDGAVRRTSFSDLLGEGFLLSGGEQSHGTGPSHLDLLKEMMAVQQRNRLHQKLSFTAEHTLALTPPTVRPFGPDLLSLMPPIAPLARPLPVYSLDELMTRGLEPLGKLFNRDGLELGMMDSERTPEAVLLKDPEAVNRCQTMVLEQLARLGPLDKRELVRLTGLPEELLEVFVDVPNTILKGAADCQAATLRTSHSAVLHQGKDGRFRLSSPEDQRTRREAALTELAGHIQKAHGALQEARENPSGDPLEQAGQVVRALHPIQGYQQATYRLVQSDLAFPKGSVELFERRLQQEFGGLAGLQLADLYSSDTSKLQEALHDARSSPFEPGDLLEPLKEAVEKEYRRASELNDPRIPTAERIAAERAEREADLSSPESWANYLQSEYRLPHKILEHLASVPEPGRVAELLPLPDLSPEVAGPVRDYLKATVQDDATTREAAVRTLLRLGTSGQLGRVELDGKVEPATKVGRTSGSTGGGGKPLARNPYWVAMTRDAESVRRLLGISQEAQFHAGPLSAQQTSLPVTNDLILEDLLVARVMGQTERVRELQAEALGLVALAEAGRYSHRWESDPLGKDFSSSPIPAATGLGFGPINDARELGLMTTSALAWARLNGRPLPLSPEDCAQALDSRLWFEQTLPLDSEGIDFARLGRLALSGVKKPPPEELNDLLGVSPEGMRMRVQSVQSSNAPWVGAIAERTGEAGLPQALWRLLERLPEKALPDPAQGETFAKLLSLHDGDSSRAGLDFARVEERVAAGEERQAVLHSLFGQASGVLPTAAGGIAQLDSGLAIGGTLLRTRRRT
ncbi:MAG: hypothetical protein AMXMBFR33_28120 [Candidatus Xenobia bacterium]